MKVINKKMLTVAALVLGVLTHGVQATYVLKVEQKSEAQLLQAVADMEAHKKRMILADQSAFGFSGENLVLVKQLLKDEKALEAAAAKGIPSEEELAGARLLVAAMDQSAKEKALRYGRFFRTDSPLIQIGDPRIVLAVQQILRGEAEAKDVTTTPTTTTTASGDQTVTTPSTTTATTTSSTTTATTTTATTSLMMASPTGVDSTTGSATTAGGDQGTQVALSTGTGAFDVDGSVEDAVEDGDDVEQPVVEKSALVQKYEKMDEKYFDALWNECKNSQDVVIAKMQNFLEVHIAKDYAEIATEADFCAVTKAVADLLSSFNVWVQQGETLDFAEAIGYLKAMARRCDQLLNSKKLLGWTTATKQCNFFNTAETYFIATKTKEIKVPVAQSVAPVAQQSRWVTALKTGVAAVAGYASLIPLSAGACGTGLIAAACELDEPSFNVVGGALAAVAMATYLLHNKSQAAKTVQAKKF